MVGEGRCVCRSMRSEQGAARRYLCVPLTVGARQLGLFRQLQVDIDACIMSLPQGDGSGEPGILIGLPSLLEAGFVARRMLHGARCTLHGVYCTVYVAHCTLYVSRCTLARLHVRRRCLHCSRRCRSGFSSRSSARAPTAPSSGSRYGRGLCHAHAGPVPCPCRACATHRQTCACAVLRTDRSD